MKLVLSRKTSEGIQNGDDIPIVVVKIERNGIRLRIEAPQQEMPRMAVRDVEVGGETIRAGEGVFLNWGCANVDPARWEDPGRFDLDRPSRQHFGFGRGVHQCFGAPLGRMEMRVTVEELLSRTDDFGLDGKVVRQVWPRLSVERLPLAFVGTRRGGAGWPRTGRSSSLRTGTTRRNSRRP